MTPTQERLIVALDVPTRDDALRLVDSIADEVVFYKVGMQLQFAGGLRLAEELIESYGKKIFLDSKLLDIDQTIKSAVAAIAKMGVSFLTVHGNGKTIRAAVEGRGASPLQILSVTYLTNLDAQDLADLYPDSVGIRDAVEQYVLARARKALEAGADGVIASGQEARQIREISGDKLNIVTPGIRPDGSPLDDQRRTTTPAEAITNGADYLVVGRPVTRASDPRLAASNIQREIAEAIEQKGGRLLAAE